MKFFTTIFLVSFYMMISHAQTPAFVQTAMISSLAYPVAFTLTPDGRYLITLKGGKIDAYDAAGTFIKTFYDLSDSTYNNFERGLLGIEIDPDYATNKYVYVYYNHRCCVSTSQTGPQFIRIVRFTDVNNTGTNPTLILNQSVSSSIAGNHMGGNIRFRPSEPNQIYITIGTLAVESNAQITTNAFGKTIRLNKNGTIPTNNPFYDDGNPATGNDDRIWDYGHRNHFDFCASTVNDSLYYAENGSTANELGDDEAGMVIKGKNCGWMTCEGFDNYNTNTPCSNSNFLPPIAVFPPVSNSLPSVTGILHYSSTVFSTLTNHLLVADNDIGRISNVTLGNAPVYNTATSNVVWADFTTKGLTTLKQGSDGCIYALEGGYNAAGKVYRICPPGLYVDETISSDYLLSFISPNPVYDKAEVNFLLNKAARVRLELFDITGKQIAVLQDEEFGSGNHSYQMNVSGLNLSSGTYMVCMKAIEGGATIYSQTRKLTVAR